ncbi:MAG: LytTR family transcriptional regulator [Bacteroidales bacterium]|nr:LytTR family transcriptional regulator [Bacteroidales bacterium]
MSDYLVLSNSNELIRIAAERLVYVSSDGNYSDVCTCDGEKRTITLQLWVVEENIQQQLHQGDLFVRIGKSLIINTRYLNYINPSKRQIILSDNHTFKFNLNASKEALKQLKDYLEQNMKSK